MAALVSFEQAKDHLRVTDDQSNADIDQKLQQASGIVLKYVESQADPGWSDGTVEVPGNHQAATLIILTHLRENTPIDWPAIERLLVGYRDPALA